MKYRMMKLDWLPFPSREPATVYIIPASSDSDDYRVIYPVSLKKNAVPLLYYGDVQIRAYEGCPQEAVAAVRQKLKEILDRRLEELTARGTYLFAGGIAVAVLGIISWTLPDPLPLAR